MAIENPSYEPDIRVLTLKRWNFPQTTQLHDMLKSCGDSLGDYISYQSHHFVSIKKAELEGSNPIASAYTGLTKLRKIQRQSSEKEVHLVQSITLLGEKTAFWDNKSEVLYITFIQLTNSSCLDYTEINQAIGEVIKKHVSAEAEEESKATWALYYSLDFCDLILFTKNVPYKTYHDILWDLAIIRSDELSVIRDSFTIYGFNREFLAQSFDQLSSGIIPEWKDRASLSINLSIQSLTTWKDFEKKLKNLEIEYTRSRTPGRYDVNLTTADLPGEKIIQLLYAIDSMCKKTPDTAFGGYEISITDSFPGEDNPITKVVNASQDRTLEEYVGNVMSQLCDEYCKSNRPSADYVDETVRSLKALLKNGFSEEFVLSVVLSFISFLRISLAAQDYPATTKLVNSIDEMTRSYFSALNTLALCTMHSERQFIQAPAFNATYFDVPPKLLAFYSAISLEIAKTLGMEHDSHYHFIITPDYRQDINVVPLELQVKSNPSEHLAVVYLCEKYFYDPSSAIKLLCHETGHYVGSRHREERAEYIFHAISLGLLSLTPLTSTVSSLETMFSGESVLDILASTLAKYMKQKFCQYNTQPTRGIQFHLSDVAEFLNNTDYGLELFANVADQQNIISQWCDSLIQKVNTSSICFNEFRKGLEYIQTTLHSEYLTQLFDSDRHAPYVYDVFVHNIADYALLIRIGLEEQQIGKKSRKSSNNEDDLNNKTDAEVYFSFCENVLQAFSEAYADLRMIEVIGCMFEIAEYDKLLSQVSSVDDLQQSMRHDAVLMVVAAEEDWERKIIPTEDSREYILYLMQAFATNQIVEYLTLCHQDQRKSSDVEEVLRAFSSTDVTKQCNIIRTRIMSYRNFLIEYCKDLLESAPLSTSYIKE